MDIREVQLEVFRQTGKSIDPDDPFFVALAMLSVTAKEIEKKNDAALREMLKTAESVNKNKSYLHQQNEKFVIDQVKQIKASVSQITSLENDMSTAITNQARAQLEPVLSGITVVSNQLKNKDSIAVELIRKTTETNDRWSHAAKYIAICFVLTSLMTSFGGFYVGKIVASKEIAKNAEWLASENGKYALQLRDAGSLQQLATCDTGQESSGWKIKDRKSCIPSPIQTKDGYLTRGWKINP